jgi:glyoxylase-like metal-dependent hydrolase (beta-lactamase superfamily II)
MFYLVLNGLSDYANVDVLVHCFYHRVGLYQGHPILSVRWPLSPMPLGDIDSLYGGNVFSLGSTNTVLIRDGDLTIVHDPGILQLGRYGAFKLRMAELGLTPDDVDMVINSHCHYDHVESNYLFRGKPLLVHEEEVRYCDQLYWPEFTKAFMGIMDVESFRGSKKVSDHVRIIETPGHTPGSVTTLVDTEEGLVAIVGDAVIVKEDLLELRPPSVITKNISADVAVESLKRISGLNPVTVIPGHDAPFSPQGLK